MQDLFTCLLPKLEDGSFAAAGAVKRNLAGTAASVVLSLVVNGKFRSAPVRFTFYSNLAITTLQPRSGPIEGGTRIQLVGRFVNHTLLVCIFNNAIIVNANFLNETVIECVSPPVSEVLGRILDIDESVKTSSLKISMNLVDFVQAPDVFTYWTTPRPTLMLPSSGPTTGNTTVRVLGEFLDGGTKYLCRLTDSIGVTIGTMSASYEDSPDSDAVQEGISARSGKYIKWVSPPLPVGKYSLWISLNGVLFTASNISFSTYNMQTALRVMPEAVARGRQSTITVIGTNFFATGLKCFVWTEAASNRTRIPGIWMESSEYFSCTLPPSSVGQKADHVNVAVSTNGQDASNAVLLKLYAPPNIGVLSCSPPPDFVLNDESAGLCAGRGQCASGGKCVCRAGYSSNACLTRWSILSLQPNVALEGHATTVIVRGFGFRKAADAIGHHCRFGQIRVAGTFVNSSSEERPSDDRGGLIDGLIRCETPKNIPPGVVSFSVSLDGVSWVSDGFSFTFYSAVDIKTVDPLSGPSSGFTVLLLNTTVRMPFSNQPACRFGSLPSVSSKWIDASSATCSTPPVRMRLASNSSMKMPATNSSYDVIVGQRLPIEFALDGQNFRLIEGLTFAYYISPSVNRLIPEAGLIVGGTNVTLVGYNFEDIPEQMCKFADSEPARVLFIDNTSVVCRAPAAPFLKAQTVGVSFSVNGKQFFKVRLIICIFTFGRPQPAAAS